MDVFSTLLCESLFSPALCIQWKTSVCFFLVGGEGERGFTDYQKSTLPVRMTLGHGMHVACTLSRY